MEEQKKTLIFSVVLSVFMTAFIVSSVMFYFLYFKENKKVSLDYEDNLLEEESLVDLNSRNEDLLSSDVEVSEKQDDFKLDPNVEVVPEGTATFIPKGAIAWQEPQKVGDLGILKGLETSDCGENVSAEYYLTGKVKSGIYKDRDLYSVRMPECGMGVYYNFLKILVNKNEIIFFKGYERFSEYEFDTLKKSIGGESKSKIINGNIIIEELVLPEKLVSGKIALHERNYESSFFTEQSYDVLKKAFMSEYGQVWVTDESKANEIYKKNRTAENSKNYHLFSTNAFYLKALDGSVISYRLSFSSLANNYKDGDDERVLELPIIFNDEIKNESYEMYPGGCGLKSYAYDFTGKLTLNDLVAVGKFKNGDVVYNYKDINHSEFKNLYEKIYFAQDGKKKSEAEFLKMYSQIFWVDPVGRLLSFYSTEIISPAECGKPVIYLYPEKEMDVQVQVFPNQGFTITDPIYPKDGWLVKATPKGVLTNYADGKNYPYLFWEGNSDEIYVRSNKGFVVSQNDLDKFFDEKLAKLGLNSQETYDFKEFWIAEMKAENKPYYFVTFVPQNFINKLAPLKIVPKPDSVIRVLMDYEGLDEFKEVEEQKIITPERKGFTAVEWGGMLH